MKHRQTLIYQPLYGHSTFAFDSTADLLDVVEGRAEGNLYTRYGLNPTIRSLERKLADLEDAEAALAFGSGMAAEAATFLSHIRTGDQIVWATFTAAPSNCSARTFRGWAWTPRSSPRAKSSGFPTS